MPRRDDQSLRAERAMERSAVGTVNPAQALQRGPRDAMIRASGLVLLTALAAAAFGRGAFFSSVQWFVVALIVAAFALALSAALLVGLNMWLAWAGVATMWDGSDPAGPAASLVNTIGGLM